MAISPWQERSSPDPCGSPSSTGPVLQATNQSIPRAPLYSVERPTTCYDRTCLSRMTRILVHCPLEANIKKSRTPTWKYARSLDSGVAETAPSSRLSPDPAPMTTVLRAAYVTRLLAQAPTPTREAPSVPSAVAGARGVSLWDVVCARGVTGDITHTAMGRSLELGPLYVLPASIVPLLAICAGGRAKQEGGQ